MSDIYATDLQEVVKILDDLAGKLSSGDVFAAQGTCIVLHNGNGYPVGRLALDDDDETWTFTPHDDNESAS